VSDTLLTKSSARTVAIHTVKLSGYHYVPRSVLLLITIHRNPFEGRVGSGVRPHPSIFVCRSKEKGGKGEQKRDKGMKNRKPKGSACLDGGDG